MSFPLMVVLASLLLAPWVGAAEKVEEESPETLATGIYRKGFRFTTADERFSIRFMGAAQLRYTYGWLDERVEGNSIDFSNFYLRRARLWFDFLSPRRLEIVGRYAQIQRLRAPSITAAMNSGLGFASIRSATGDLHHALERRIRELTLGLNLYLSRDHQHKVFVDTSRLTREFAGFVGGDEGLGAPPDQRDTRVRAMLQLKF